MKTRDSITSKQKPLLPSLEDDHKKRKTKTSLFDKVGTAILAMNKRNKIDKSSVEVDQQKENIHQLFVKQLAKVLQENCKNCNPQLAEELIHKILNNEIDTITHPESLYMGMTLAIMDHYHIDPDNLETMNVEVNIHDCYLSIIKYYGILSEKGLAGIITQHPDISEDILVDFSKHNANSEIIQFVESLDESNKAKFVRTCIEEYKNVKKQNEITIKVGSNILLASPVKIFSILRLFYELDENYYNFLENIEDLEEPTPNPKRSQAEMDEFTSSIITQQNLEMFEKISTLERFLETQGFVRTQDRFVSRKYLSDPNFFSSFQTWSKDNYNYEIKSSDDELYIIISVKPNQYYQKTTYKLNQLPDKTEFEAMIARTLESYKLRTEFKINNPQLQEIQEPSKASYKGKYIVRYGIPTASVNQDLQANDQILIITEDGRQESVSSNLISKNYQSQELKYPDTTVEFLDHEITHAMATGILHHGMIRLIKKFKNQDNPNSRSHQTYSIIGEGIVAQLTQKLIKNRFNASTTNYNHTLLLTEFYVDYIFKILQADNPTNVNINLTKSFNRAKYDLREKYLARKRRYAGLFANKKTNDLINTLDTLKKDATQILSSPPELRAELKKKIKEESQSEFEVDFDFSKIGFYEAIESLDTQEFTRDFFKYILKTLYPKTLSEGLGKLVQDMVLKEDISNNTRGILKTKDDNTTQIPRSVDGDIINNFMIWYNSLEDQDKNSFSEWLISDIGNLDQQESAQYIEKCSRFFGNIATVLSPNNTDVLECLEYSKELLDMGGVSAVF
jgi:hypothetical protein